MAQRKAPSPTSGITDGSGAWFILSAFLTNVIITVSLARLVSGTPVPERKVIITTVFFAAVSAASLRCWLGAEGRHLTATVVRFTL